MPEREVCPYDYYERTQPYPGGWAAARRGAQCRGGAERAAGAADGVPQAGLGLWRHWLHFIRQQKGHRGLQKKPSGRSSWRRTSWSSRRAASACAPWAPFVIVYPEGAFYTSDDAGAHASEIVKEHHHPRRAGRERPALRGDGPARWHDHLSEAETRFYKKQKRVALRNCGVIDPENIEEYIAADGYQALAKVLTDHDARRGHRDCT